MRVSDIHLQPRRPATLWFAPAAVLSFCFSLIVQAAPNQTLWATGDSDNLWVLQSGDNRQTFRVLHRSLLDQPSHLLHLADSLRGCPVTTGVASADDRLWIVYEPATSNAKLPVQSVQLQPPTNAAPWSYGSATFKPALWSGILVRALAANRNGPWTLIRVEDQATLRQIDASRHTPNGPATPSPPPDNPSPAAERSEAIREDRLLRLDRNIWVREDLPVNWPGDSRTWLVMRTPDETAPLIVTATPEDDRIDVTVYERRHNTWSPRNYEVRPDPISHEEINGSKVLESRELVVLAVDGQVVLGLADLLKRGVSLDLWVLLPQAATSLGTLEVESPAAPRAWAVVPYGNEIALLAATDKPSFAWARMDLQGRAHTPPNIAESIPQPLEQATDHILLVAVVATAMLIMLVFWRREPAHVRLSLPKDTRLADLGWRAGAAAVDFLPCVLVSAFVFKIDPGDLLEHWPGRSGGWHQTLPGALTIGLFVAHTLLSELFTAQTLGKAMMGLRVASLDGQPPHVWQVLTRNVMKVFDLIAWPLLIMPMIGLHRQRLGDIAARTVVITATDPDHHDDEV